MFDVDQLVGACTDAVHDAEPRLAVRDVLERALAAPGAVADVMAPQEGGLTMLHVSPEVTVVHAVWAPGMQLFPHDHRMWAVIGIYAGEEDNTFYRRTGADGGALERSGGKLIDVGDVLVLGDDVVHAVANPGDRLTGAIHVYGGDFLHHPRSQWGPGPLEERPFDLDDVHRQFADANRAWRAR